jgi:acetyl esterase/lipase
MIGMYPSHRWMNNLYRDCRNPTDVAIRACRPRTWTALAAFQEDSGSSCGIFLVLLSLQVSLQNIHRIRWPKCCHVLLLTHTKLFHRGNNHGPPLIRKLSSKLSKRLTSFQAVALTLIYLYLARNFGKLVGLECPEPLANLYTRSFFRATWITTALDAGFWTAMPIKPKPIRDILSMVFSVYYLIAAEQADEKVRKIRACITVDHMRVSWNKTTTPYLGFFNNLLRPRLTRYRYQPRALRIPRPPESVYKEPINAWLYFDGPISALKSHTKVVLDFPGGGFVSMSPRNHDDKLLAWCGKLGVPVLSIDYRKAPEAPYPYALNECHDAYSTLIQSKGRCIGLSGEVVPKVVLTGDSAGGNFAAGVTLMVLQASTSEFRRYQDTPLLPTPDGVVLIYPGLDMNIGSWMTDEQMALIKDRKTRKTNRSILRRKSMDYKMAAGDRTPHVSDDEEDYFGSPPKLTPETTDSTKPATGMASVPPELAEAAKVEATLPVSNAERNAEAKKSPSTRLAMCSLISYFNDRILTPEMLRAMIILYIGPHNRPDFTTDYLLSPVLAPDALLARFPKTYFLTGERDPLVDDTVIMAGRIRQAKQSRWRERRELGLTGGREMNESEWLEVSLIPGISHGFLQLVGVYPEGWKHIDKCARWIDEIFTKIDRDEKRRVERSRGNLDAAVSDYFADDTQGERHHKRTFTSGSSGEEDKPLEMSFAKVNEAKGAARKKSGNRSDSTDDPNDAYRLKAKRNQSTMSLASHEDLVSRRMEGLAGGLTGLAVQEPRTPGF